MKRIAAVLLALSACSTPPAVPCQAETDCAACQSCVDGACQDDASKLNACGTCGDVFEICGDGLDNNCDGVVDDGCALCGNGKLDPGEKCDGNCPTSCNDSVACTRDTLVGSAASCNAVCTHTAITGCIPGDGCCPAACNRFNDSDCQSRCGNGVVETGEKCDGNCPTSCDDKVACTKDTLTGSAANCTAVCTHTAITACVAGDGCCPSACNSLNDSDCSPRCGNGVVEAGEKCDGNCPASCNDNVACTKDALIGSAAGCSAECTHTPITACVSGDGCCPSGCNANTDSDCSATCGNGIVEGGEKCDGNCPTACNDNVACTKDALVGTAAACSAECTFTPITACVAGDGCCPAGCNNNTDSDCSATCGNGIVEGGEKCDGNCPTNCNDNVACTKDSLIGSASNCSSQCLHEAIVACANGDGCCPAGCNSTNDSDCAPKCGNSVVETGETCDGNCPTSCNDNIACTKDTKTGTAASCNVVCTHTAITQCVGGDGCCPAGCNANTDSDCQPVCGNGVVETGETCDPTASCPTNCNDNNACTADLLLGSAATCDVSCSHTAITACTSGDGCCPAGCVHATDTDCACIPACAGVQCGDDGCGGSCGQCTVPPAATCVNATTLRTFSGGTCQPGGTCSFVQTDSACPNGCTQGACLPATGCAAGVAGCGSSVTLNGDDHYWYNRVSNSFMMGSYGDLWSGTMTADAVLNGISSENPNAWIESGPANQRTTLYLGSPTHLASLPTVVAVWGKGGSPGTASSAGVTVNMTKVSFAIAQTVGANKSGWLVSANNYLDEYGRGLAGLAVRFDLAVQTFNNWSGSCPLILRDKNGQLASYSGASSATATFVATFPVTFSVNTFFCGTRTVSSNDFTYTISNVKIFRP